jgi:hypothetical protein
MRGKLQDVYLLPYPRTSFKKRASLVMEAMNKKTSAIVHQFAPDRSELQGACRLFGNPALTPEVSFKALSLECATVVKDKTILLIEDTTSIQRTHMSGLHAASDPDIGRMEKNTLRGFFVHPVLAVEAATGMPLGIASGLVWNRDGGNTPAPKGSYAKKPRSQKESTRWITCLQAALKATTSAQHRIGVADREGDIDDLYALASQASVDDVSGSRTDVVVRARSDRQQDGGTESIFTAVSQAEVCLGLHCEVRTKSGKRRIARLEVRTCAVQIARPKRADENLPDSISCFVIEAKEILPDEGLPEGEEAVHWRILTTVPIHSAADAEQVLRWYCRRWQIEQLFRLLKTEGLRVEQSQLERGAALKNMVVFALAVALKLLQATTAREIPVALPLEVLFTAEEQVCAEILIPKYEGKTDAQKNPYPKRTLMRYLWLVARLGGWKGYKSESLPGPITFRRGFERFTTMVEAWTIFKEQTAKHHPS